MYSSSSTDNFLVSSLLLSTIAFCLELPENNIPSPTVRDPEYRRSFKDWESFVETLTERITEADETIPELPIKDVIFRIYRDIRFSKDQTPYKVCQLI